MSKSSFTIKLSDRFVISSVISTQNWSPGLPYNLQLLHRHARVCVIIPQKLEIDWRGEGGPPFWQQEIVIGSFRQMFCLKRIPSGQASRECSFPSSCVSPRHSMFCSRSLPDKPEVSRGTLWRADFAPLEGEKLSREGGNSSAWWVAARLLLPPAGGNPFLGDHGKSALKLCGVHPHFYRASWRS